MMTPEEEAQVDIAVPRGRLSRSLVLSFKLCLPPATRLVFGQKTLIRGLSLVAWKSDVSRRHVRANKIKMASFKVTFNWFSSSVRERQAPCDVSHPTISTCIVITGNLCVYQIASSVPWQVHACYASHLYLPWLIFKGDFNFFPQKCYCYWLFFCLVFGGRFLPNYPSVTGFCWGYWWWNCRQTGLPHTDSLFVEHKKTRKFSD